MPDLLNDFKKLSVKSLGEAVSRVTGINTEQTEEDLRQYVFPRLDFMSGQGEELYFIFEENYVETEWKDMISVHYINTSYFFRQSVMRVHLFVKNMIDSNYYLGCFTLRIIDDVRFMLSYIYPNWKRIQAVYADETYVMTFRKTVHIMGREIEFSTYPLFVQDNAVVKCAEASMISMTKYLHAKYDYNNIRILNLADSYFTGKAKLFPTKGLIPTQMMEVFNYHNIPMECEVCDEEPEKLQRYIDFCIESAVPVLLGVLLKDNREGVVNKHVVQVIGHTLSKNKDERGYIIYDDSGYFVRSFGMDGFVSGFSWEQLKEKLISRKSFVMYPIHEKVYTSFRDIKDVFEDLKNRIKVEEIFKKAGKRINNMRILLADNAVLKDFLKNKIILDTVMGDEKQMQDEIDSILKKSLPHYLWYCEFQSDNCNLVFFADPTYNNKTTKNIIVNHTPIVSINVLSMLERLNKS